MSFFPPHLMRRPAFEVPRLIVPSPLFSGATSIRNATFNPIPSLSWPPVQFARVCPFLFWPRSPSPSMYDWKASQVLPLHPFFFLSLPRRTTYPRALSSYDLIAFLTIPLSVEPRLSLCPPGSHPFACTLCGLPSEEVFGNSLFFLRILRADKTLLYWSLCHRPPKPSLTPSTPPEQPLPVVSRYMNISPDDSPVSLSFPSTPLENHVDPHVPPSP